MTDQIDHYANVLAQHYTWMFGVPFEQKVAEQSELLRQLGGGSPGLAVDLGCGSGFQTLALADLGASQVLAIDTSRVLLDELESRAGQRPVRTFEMDLACFDGVLEQPADTIVCMGDTLTHLASLGDVTALIARVADCLRKGGLFVLSWRDLSNPPSGVDRFIQLRSCDEKVMVCFLEDLGEKVLVHDLISTCEPGGWKFYKSSYPKLKITPELILESLETCGFSSSVQCETGGMTVVAAVR